MIRLPPSAACLVAALLSACAGPGFRYSIVETNATSSMLDITARTELTANPARGADYLRRNIPESPIGASTATLVGHITSIGGQCNGQGRITCVLNRREVTRGLRPDGPPEPGVTTWRMVISWADRPGPVRPSVQLSGHDQRL